VEVLTTVFKELEKMGAPPTPARFPMPLEPWKMVFNRNAVVADFMRAGRRAATALRLEMFVRR
jgi:hypothetical protein